MPTLNKYVCKVIDMKMAAQSIMFNPIKKTNKISFCKIELSTEYIKTLIKKPIAFDKKYVWIPKINIPTILLNNPKNWAPLNLSLIHI